jgi:hypothetical protein
MRTFRRAAVAPGDVSTPKITGRYVVAFVESAGEVSAVFRNKAETILAAHGINSPVEAEYYDVRRFGDALRSVDETAGSEHVEAAGERMVRVNKHVEQQDSPVAAITVMGEQHEVIHRDYDIEIAGGYVVDTESADGCEVGLLGEYPYPLSLPRGALRGAVKVGGGDATGISVEAVTPREGEFARFAVSW